MPKLKIIIIILLIGIAAALVVASLRRQASPEPKVPATPLPSINNPAPNLDIQGAIPDVPLPAIVPLFTPTSPNPQIVASLITTSFGLEAPEALSLPNGTQKFSWRPQAGELNYYAPSHSLSYLFPQALDVFFSPQLETTAKEVSDAFIRSHLPLQAPLDFTLIKTIYLKSNETMGTQVPSLALANTLQFEYRFLLDQTPLYLEPLEQADIVVLVNAAGIRSLKAKVPPAFTKSGQSAPLIARSQILQKLQDRDYSLIKVNNDQYYGEGPLFNVDQLTVKSIGLGYLSTQNQLTPIFVLSGTAPHASDNNTTYILELAIDATNP
jgi:hypothetical protein